MEAMKLLLTNTGSYPRVGDTAELQQLRRAHSSFERQEATAEELRAAEDAMVRAALKEQAEAGLDLVTDGQIRWSDPIAHLAGKLAGVKINGLLRFFDTNFYFRQPIVQGEMAWKDGLLLSEYEFARQNSAKPVKPVLTGAYTLARHSIAEHAPYKQLDALSRAYATALAGEVEALAKAGAEVIQVDEPAILKHPADFPLLERGLLMVGRHRLKAKLALYLYFGDALHLYDRLQKLPVDILGLDFTYNPKFVERVVTAGSDKPLALGLVDGRNTRLEEAGAVAHQVDRLLLRVKGQTCYLNPSCGLEYLPRDRAFAKLKLLGQVRSLVKRAQ